MKNLNYNYRKYSMENQKNIDDKLLAIMEFIHHYDPQVSLNLLLNGYSFHKLVQSIQEHQFDFNLRIDKQSGKWSDRLQNLQSLLFKIQQYFQTVHQKCLQCSHIDLICLTKNQDLCQLVKYFQIIMILLMESSKKQQFIQSIMMLQQSSQQVFVEIIKNSLDGRRFTQSKYRHNTFYRIISQFEQQKLVMQKQIDRLCKANMELLSKIKQYEDTISQIQLDLSTKKSSMDTSADQGKNLRYLEEYIDKLQARIVQQTKIYEQEKLCNSQKLREFHQKITKLQEAQQLGKIYKQKYDQIMDQMQKMNIWKRQKSKMQKTLEQKDFMVLKLHDRIQQLTEKNLSLQQTELELKLDLQKKQIKIQKMSGQLKKVMENIGHSNPSYSTKVQGQILDQSIRECANSKIAQEQSLFSSDEQLTQMRRETQKLLKKNKQQQKEICKLSKKVERLRVLQEDKNKLEQLVFQLRLMQSQELNLMFSVYYEGFEQNIQISKKLRHELLSFSQQQQARKIKHLRKRTGSNLSKGKQNWKQVKPI